MRLSPLDDGGLPSIPEGRPAAQLPPVRESSRSPRLSPRGTSPSQSSPYAGPQSTPFATDSPRGELPSPSGGRRSQDASPEDGLHSTQANPLAGGLSGGKAGGPAPPRSARNEMSDYISYYMEALQNHPEDPSLHNVLGVALAKQGDLDMAIKHYTTALELDMTFFPAHYNLGRARYRQGRLEDAIAHYTDSLRLNPDDKKAHNSLGIVLAEQGKVDDAISHFQEASRIMEGMLEMQPLNQRFRAPALEEEFAGRRIKQAMIPTRLLIIVSMIATGVNFGYSAYDMVTETGREEALLLEMQLGGGAVEGAGQPYTEQEELMFDSRLHTGIYGVELVIGLITLLLTWHRDFYVYQPLVLSVYIVTYFVGVLIMAWLTLNEEEDGYSMENGSILSLNWKLHTTFLWLVRDFTISLAIPQVCGLRWTLMPIIYTILAGTYCSLCYQTRSLAAFVNPVLLVAVTVIGVLMAYWVERAERDVYKMGKLYITEKECRAQSEADWRKAAAERHESDLAKIAAQTELRTRSQFVSWIFHEIRNPLNAMWGAIQMFGATASSPKQKEWVAMAMASSNMVSNVLNDVLSLNKIEEGHLELKCGWFSIVGAIEEVKFMFSEEAVRNGVQLRCSVGDPETGGAGDGDLKVFADVDRLKEVLANFCSNAVKFTESGGTVHLHASVTMRSGAPELPVRDASGEFEPTADLNVSVTDTGRGVAPEDFDKLFVAYSQVTPAVRASGRGKSSTGLGLCITKHIIDAHGGEVYVRSDGVGKGSTFGFSLPVPTTSGYVEEVVDASDGSSDRLTTPFADGPASEPDKGEDQAVHNILIVDDDDFNCRVIQDMVQSVGWTCSTAADGARALELIGKHGSQHFACVVSDCIMPVLDGWQLTQEIQRQDLPLPVVGLTGSVSEHDLNRCREVGMKEVLTKPVKMVDLVQTVRRVVQSCATLQRRRVLLVDDDDFNLTIVKDMLEECGWACVTAHSGAEALELLGGDAGGVAAPADGGVGVGADAVATGARPPFVCVITDMIMPGMDGCQLAEQIRARGKTRAGYELPVVGLTGTTLSAELQRCLDAGMTHVLAKPVDMRELNATLERLTTKAPKSPVPRSPPELRLDDFDVESGGEISAARAAAARQPSQRGSAAATGAPDSYQAARTAPRAEWSTGATDAAAGHEHLAEPDMDDL